MKIKSYIVLLSIVILIASCTKENPVEDKPKFGNNTEKHTSELKGKIYPHNTSFSFYHGKYYKKDTNSCKNCHGKDHLGGETKISCFSCHDGFHPGRKRPRKHGSEFIKNPKKCTNCHKVQKDGDLEGARCFDCHSYPHPKNWAVGSAHGKLSQKMDMEGVNKKKKCSYCHKKNSRTMKKFPEKIKTCDHCHIMMPHPGNKDEWDDENTFRGGKHLGLLSNCLLCHKVLKEGTDEEHTQNLENYDTCTDCHDGEPKTKLVEEGDEATVGHIFKKEKRLLKAASAIKKAVHKKRRVISSKKTKYKKELKKK